MFGIFVLQLKAVQLPKFISYPLQRRELALSVSDIQRSIINNESMQVLKKKAIKIIETESKAKVTTKKNFFQ